MTKESKYGFGNLDVGESYIYYTTDLRVVRCIRGAATNWGTRYGVWLKVAVVPGGVRISRVESASTQKRARDLKLEDRLRRIEDGLKWACVMLAKIKTSIDELNDKAETK